MKRYYLSVFCATVLIATFAIGYYTIPNQENGESELLLANIEALSQSTEDETIYDYRVVRCCDCWKGSSFQGISIIECEKYVWQIPAVKQNCKTTSCPKGSNC